MSTGFSACPVPAPNNCAARSSNWVFHCVIWFGCTSNWCQLRKCPVAAHCGKSHLRLELCRVVTAGSSAHLSLLSPRALSCPQSGSDSTYPPVQISGATSEVYQRPYDGNEVLVCMDETSKQQVKETRVPRPAAPGLSAAYDYEYERNGVSSLFMLFAPLDGWRRVEVRERRTKVDWAHVIKKLVDEDYPDRDRIVLVMDNLNTHKLSSPYEAFEPAEARRIAERLEIHYTPKHGSWLNMAEIEIGVLARQCLDRRIANQDILRGEVNAWQNQRNRDVIRVDWRFTTEDARIKLKSLYPSIQKC